MKRFFFCIIILFALVTSCKLTEKSVAGKWLSYRDTLSINKDHTFSLSYKTGYHLKEDESPLYDTGRIFYSGKWTILNKFLKLEFSQDSGKNIFGDCEGLYKQNKLFSKYILLRFKTCKSPTHYFVTFSKIM